MTATKFHSYEHVVTSKVPAEAIEVTNNCVSENREGAGMWVGGNKALPKTQELELNSEPSEANCRMGLCSGLRTTLKGRSTNNLQGLPPRASIHGSDYCVRSCRRSVSRLLGTWQSAGIDLRCSAVVRCKCCNFYFYMHFCSLCCGCSLLLLLFLSSTSHSAIDMRS
jgi:hypothetical protein